MFPWFWWQLAPHFEFPLSGNVSQDILLDRFFSSIKQLAGDGRIEQKAFESASYGKQIGLISEVLLSLADSSLVDESKAKKSLKELEAVYNKIENIKSNYSSSKIEEATNALMELKLSDPPQFERVLAELVDPKSGKSSKPILNK